MYYYLGFVKTAQYLKKYLQIYFFLSQINNTWYIKTIYLDLCYSFCKHWFSTNPWFWTKIPSVNRENQWRHNRRLSTALLWRLPVMCYVRHGRLMMLMTTSDWVCCDRWISHSLRGTQITNAVHGPENRLWRNWMLINIVFSHIWHGLIGKETFTGSSWCPQAT